MAILVGHLAFQIERAEPSRLGDPEEGEGGEETYIMEKAFNSSLQKREKRGSLPLWLYGGGYFTYVLDGV